MNIFFDCPNIIINKLYIIEKCLFMSLVKKLLNYKFKFRFKGEYMKYSVKQLAKNYVEFLNENKFEVKIPSAQSCNINSYNEYSYQKLMQQYELLYNHTDSLDLTEKFLKGD